MGDLNFLGIKHTCMAANLGILLIKEGIKNPLAFSELGGAHVREAKAKQATKQASKQTIMHQERWSTTSPAINKRPRTEMRGRAWAVALLLSLGVSTRVHKGQASPRVHKDHISKFCVVSPTYHDHFINTIAALEGIQHNSNDTVQIFVIVTNTVEADAFELLASRYELPEFSLLDLANLTLMNSSELEAAVSATAVEAHCSFGGGIKHQWGHLKKMVSTNPFDSAFRPRSHGGFIDSYSVRY